LTESQKQEKNANSSDVLKSKTVLEDIGSFAFKRFNLESLGKRQDGMEMTKNLQFSMSHVM